MTEDQKETLADILAKYDPENMTAEDRKNMKQDIVDAGIPKSRDAMEMLREAGFMKGKDKDPQTEALKAKSPQGKGQLWDLYKEFQDGRITEAEFLAQVRGQSNGSLLDILS